MKNTDQKGQVLIFMSLAFVLLGLMAGLGVDLGRGYLMKAQLMRTVDAATLAGAKALKGQADFEDEAVTAACDAAEMNGLTCGQGSDFDMSVGFVDKDVSGGPPMRFIEITANASVPTTLLRLLNLVNVGDFSTLNVSAFAQGGPERPVDLAIVLDRSGSMNTADGTGTQKIAALKTAVNEFLDSTFSTDDRIGIISFASRGCGVGGNDSTATNCAQDQPLGTSINNLKNTVNALCPNAQPNPCVGGTNTMEALRVAGNAINTAFATPGRERSRKAVLLVTDGQPTFMRRFTDPECKQNPQTGSSLPAPGGTGSFPNGCLHGVSNWTSSSFWSSSSQKPALMRSTLTSPNSFPCSTRIPGFRTFASDSCASNTNAALYRNAIAGARIAAVSEANTVRNYGLAGGKDVAVFVIAIGRDTSTTEPQGSLDANARCLLARIANDPNSIGNCSSVFTTTVDGDTHSDLIQNWTCGTGPCIDNTQEKGKVFTVDLNGDVQEQLKAIFAEVAALLKLRLTI